MSLEDEITQLKAMVAQLKGKNAQLTGEVAQYKREAYAPDKQFVPTTKVYSLVDEGPAVDDTPAAHRLKAQARFQSIDVNGDGTLDELEPSAGLCDSGLAGNEIEARFFNLDNNGDNKVGALLTTCC